MPGCSAVLITLNESARIAQAVESVLPWVDEVLVLDGGSQDDTTEVAEAAGARVLVHPFDGFIAQKQRATELARHELVFSLDADERVDEDLGRGIVAACRRSADSDCRGWLVRRRNYLDGRALRASGWYPDLRVRLFDRRFARWAGAEPHDRIEMAGSVAALPGHLHHDPERTSAQFRRATSAHARRRACSLAGEGRRVFPWTPWLHGLAHLLRKFVLSAAWLDGRRGLTVAWYGSRGVVNKYRLAARIQEENR